MRGSAQASNDDPTSDDFLKGLVKDNAQCISRMLGKQEQTDENMKQLTNNMNEMVLQQQRQGHDLSELAESQRVDRERWNSHQCQQSQTNEEFDSRLKKLECMQQQAPAGAASSSSTAPDDSVASHDEDKFPSSMKVPSNVGAMAPQPTTTSNKDTSNPFAPVSMENDNAPSSHMFAANSPCKKMPASSSRINTTPTKHPSFNIGLSPRKLNKKMQKKSLERKSPKAKATRQPSSTSPKKKSNGKQRMRCVSNNNSKAATSFPAKKPASIDKKPASTE